MKEIKLKITLLEDMLGTAAEDQETHENYVAIRSDDVNKMEEEVKTIPSKRKLNDVYTVPMTIFSRDNDGNPIMWDYQFKGLFKDACSMLKRIPGTKSSKIKAYKKDIDGLIFVKPRKVPIHLSGPMSTLQRPLRASTPQGERIALAKSETIPAGSTIELTVLLMADSYEEVLFEWLDYGKLRGIGQWRNAGYGRYTYEVLS